MSLSIPEDRFQPSDFEPPEFSRVGPLLGPFGVGRVFSVHLQPAVFILAGSPECGLKRGTVPLAGRSAHLNHVHCVGPKAGTMGYVEHQIKYLTPSLGAQIQRKGFVIWRPPNRSPCWRSSVYRKSHCDWMAAETINESYQERLLLAWRCNASV